MFGVENLVCNRCSISMKHFNNILNQHSYAFFKTPLQIQINASLHQSSWILVHLSLYFSIIDMWVEGEDIHILFSIIDMYVER
jgi:hypothetical protein